MLRNEIASSIRRRGHRTCRMRHRRRSDRDRQRFRLRFRSAEFRRSRHALGPWSMLRGGAWTSTVTGTTRHRSASPRRRRRVVRLRSPLVPRQDEHEPLRALRSARDLGVAPQRSARAPESRWGQKQQRLMSAVVEIRISARTPPACARRCDGLNGARRTCTFRTVPLQR